MSSYLPLAGNRGDIPEGLKEANIEVYTNDECSNSWGDGIYPGHVCVGDVSNRRGSCNVSTMVSQRIWYPIFGTLYLVPYIWVVFLQKYFVKITPFLLLVLFS